MSIVVTATSGHLGRLIVRDLLARGVPAADVAAGRIRVPITATYSLEEASQALEDYRAGAVGKLAIQVAPAREQA